jgi:hypothetical protein
MIRPGSVAERVLEPERTERHSIGERITIMGNQDVGTMRARILALVITGVCLGLSGGCGNKSQPSTAEASTPQTDPPKAEPKSVESRSAEPDVQAEIGRMDAERRAKLLADAQSALEETRSSIIALDKGDKRAALAALEHATGKLDLIVARDHTLTLAPVGVTTIIHDLYTTVDAVKATVKRAKDDLADGQVQQARDLLADLASEADIQVTDLPLATYPAAIKAVVPLIDGGKVDDAKAALYAALHTLVIEDYVIPLPKVRAQSMLRDAQKLAGKSNRTADENDKVHSLINAAQSELKLAEALGYGTKDSYKPLYEQIADVQKQIDTGQTGKGLFEKLQDSLKRLKFRV